MALLDWSDELSVGIDVIDKQHMILVRSINLLATAIENKSERELLAAIFETLADYTVSHFAYEEELFDKYGFPETEHHKETHKALLEKVTTFKKKFDAGEEHLGPDMLKFLVEWLTKHIMGTDKRYSAFLIEAMKQQRSA
jgi:methyl-accepting chemotaxis protein/hemerythrin